MPTSFLLKRSTRKLMKNTYLKHQKLKQNFCGLHICLCILGLFVFSMFFIYVLRVFQTSFIGSFLSPDWISLLDSGISIFYHQTPSHPLNSICKVSAHTCLVALTPGQASSPCCPTKMYSSSSFSRWKVAEMKTPWDLLLWFLAPFPPAAP